MEIDYWISTTLAKSGIQICRLSCSYLISATPPSLTVIIVDADSTDGTPEAVAHYYPKAIVLQVGAEDYWSATTNAGVRFALAHQFDYILTINDDCTIAPDHVQVLFDTA